MATRAGTYDKRNSKPRPASTLTRTTAPSAIRAFVILFCARRSTASSFMVASLRCCSVSGIGSGAAGPRPPVPVHPSSCAAAGARSRYRMGLPRVRGDHPADGERQAAESALAPCPHRLSGSWCLLPAAASPPGSPTMVNSGRALFKSAHAPDTCFPRRARPSPRLLGDHPVRPSFMKSQISDSTSYSRHFTDHRQAAFRRHPCQGGVPGARRLPRYVFWVPGWLHPLRTPVLIDRSADGYRTQQHSLCLGRKPAVLSHRKAASLKASSTASSAACRSPASPTGQT